MVLWLDLSLDFISFPFFYGFYDFGCAEEVNKRSLVGGVVIEDCLVWGGYSTGTGVSAYLVDRPVKQNHQLPHALYDP